MHVLRPRAVIRDKPSTLISNSAEGKGSAITVRVHLRVLGNTVNEFLSATTMRHNYLRKGNNSVDCDRDQVSARLFRLRIAKSNGDEIN